MFGWVSCVDIYSRKCYIKTSTGYSNWGWIMAGPLSGGLSAVELLRRQAKSNNLFSFFTE